MSFSLTHRVLLMLMETCPLPKRTEGVEDWTVRAEGVGKKEWEERREGNCDQNVKQTQVYPSLETSFEILSVVLMFTSNSLTSHLVPFV